MPRQKKTRPTKGLSKKDNAEHRVPVVSRRSPRKLQDTAPTTEEGEDGDDVVIVEPVVARKRKVKVPPQKATTSKHVKTKHPSSAGKREALADDVINITDEETHAITITDDTTDAADNDTEVDDTVGDAALAKASAMAVSNSADGSFGDTAPAPKNRRSVSTDSGSSMQPRQRYGYIYTLARTSFLFTHPTTPLYHYNTFTFNLFPNAYVFLCFIF